MRFLNLDSSFSWVMRSPFSHSMTWMLKQSITSKHTRPFDIAAAKINYRTMTCRQLGLLCSFAHACLHKLGVGDSCLHKEGTRRSCQLQAHCNPGSNLADVQHRHEDPVSSNRVMPGIDFRKCADNSWLCSDCFLNCN